MRASNVTRNFSGNSNRNRLVFNADFDSAPDKGDIAEAQIQAGYHPAGYGGPWDIAITQHGNVFSAQWSCSNSCE